MTYEVSVTRDGAWWMVAVPALDAVTQARTLGEVDAAAGSWWPSTPVPRSMR